MHRAWLCHPRETPRQQPVGLPPIIGPMPSPIVSTAGHPATESTAFKQALSRFATGVTVITTRTTPCDTVANPQGLVGLTASSFNTVSLSPPLVLWSLGRQSRSLSAFVSNDHYVVNVLSATQLDLCERFAWGSGDRFADLVWSPAACGLPILHGALAWFECRHRSRHEEGDHLIFVGEVERCGTGEDAPPLVYQHSRFCTTQVLDPGRDG
jgi:flavin reductase (DIM6/NTAB) family NADH-FMN oxidoreductase RutF